MRANASNKHTWTPKRCAEELGRIDERIRTILRECEQTDIAEESDPSLSLPKRLQDERTLRAKVEGILEELNRNERTGLNTTDPEAGRVRIGAQVESGYNCQAVVDDRYGLIVHAEVSDAGNDVGQFGPQINSAQEILGKRCERACADTGYSSPGDLQKILDQDVDVVVPIVRHSDFRDHFRFDAERNEYQCPEGHRLPYLGKNNKTRATSMARVTAPCACAAHDSDNALDRRKVGASSARTPKRCASGSSSATSNRAQSP